MMGLNKHKPHLRIIPEDKAIDQLAFKFIRKYFEPSQIRQIEREDFSGGFKGAEEQFKRLCDELKNQNCYLLLLVDCDGHVERVDFNDKGEEVHREPSRAETLLERVEKVYQDRVFILTFERESEDFLGKFDPPKNSVGDRLAELCLDPDHVKLRPQWDEAEKDHLIRPKNTVTRLREMLSAL